MFWLFFILKTLILGTKKTLCLDLLLFTISAVADLIVIRVKWHKCKCTKSVETKIQFENQCKFVFKVLMRAINYTYILQKYNSFTLIQLTKSTFEQFYLENRNSRVLLLYQIARNVRLEN